MAPLSCKWCGRYQEKRGRGIVHEEGCRTRLLPEGVGYEEVKVLVWDGAAWRLEDGLLEVRSREE